ncbi:hypothetical protein LCGC14_1324670 [marine sediment metagenome]|uniref:Phosphoribosyltransferase domain-containing protein n=1 Tax=marine sediment metagenome TaxID=412755 RepID=A0A0F9KJ14_9ZZZZ|nr:MAG: hypothetical protein Lokiarch_26280 [Candidatus Lokiarchaeum sp. GC14_75]
MKKSFSRGKRFLVIPEINFEYGRFKFKRKNIQGTAIIKGKFNLSISPTFSKAFEKYFWLYDLESEVVGNTQISLGPYYPIWKWKEDKNKIHDFFYPAFSDILLDSKSGKLLKPHITDETKKARIQQLQILSNFFATYIQKIGLPIYYDRIIPVPAKPSYSFNSIEIICNEFNKIFQIPIDTTIITRNSDIRKSYDIKMSHNLNNSKILLIDDIITAGDTKGTICTSLNKFGCEIICMLTLGRTDHNIYEYDK